MENDEHMHRMSELPRRTYDVKNEMFISISVRANEFGIGSNLC